MKKRGISLIMLVITIIIILILAGAVILNLNNNNPVNHARVANVQQTRDSLKSGINLYIAKIMVKENGNHYASTMILGKNSSVINYSIVIDYSIYRTVKGNLNVWELDYDAVADKVNLKLDIYDSNSRWYIDEYGNPYLVYNTLANVSPYLKTEDGSAVLASVADFVVVAGDNKEFAYLSQFYNAKKNRSVMVDKFNTYLSNIKTNSQETTLSLLTTGSAAVASASDTSSITVNGENTTIYKINTSDFTSKVGVTLDSYANSNWYLDENGNTYLIFDENVTIPETLSSSVYTSNYVTNVGGTITGSSSVVIINNSNNDNNQNSGNNNNNNEPVVGDGVTTFAASNFNSMTAQEKYNNFMGKEVTNYTSKNGWNSWQIFYADDDNIYLISKGYVPVSYLPTGHGFEVKSDYMVYSNISRSDLINKLTSATTFDTFKDSFGIAKEARIPTIEEFCTSYNSVAHSGSTYENNPIMQNIYYADNGENGGYNVSENSPVLAGSYYTSCGMPQDESNSLWVISDTSKAKKGYWLASEGSYGVDDILGVSFAGNVSGWYGYNVDTRRTSPNSCFK